MLSSISLLAKHIGSTDQRHLRKVLVLDSVYFSSGILCKSLRKTGCSFNTVASEISNFVQPQQLHASAPSDQLHPWQVRRHVLIHTIKLTGGHSLYGQQDADGRGQTCKIGWHAVELSELERLFRGRHKTLVCLSAFHLCFMTTVPHDIRGVELRRDIREREDFTSSANQLGCTDVPGLSVTWSKTSVLSVYHV